MENILVVIRDEIRKNREVLEEIRDLLKDRRGTREMMKHAPERINRSEETVRNNGKDQSR